MLDTNEGCVEYNSLIINESDSEGIKEGTSLGFKDNIIDDDILWSTEGSLDFIFDVISEGHAKISPFSTWHYIFGKSGISDGLDK